MKKKSDIGKVTKRYTKHKDYQTRQRTQQKTNCNANKQLKYNTIIKSDRTFN